MLPVVEAVGSVESPPTDCMVKSTVESDALPSTTLIVLPEIGNVLLTTPSVTTCAADAMLAATVPPEADAPRLKAMVTDSVAPSAIRTDHCQIR